MRFASLLILCLLAASPAHAGPVVAAISAIAGSISAATASIGILGRLAIWAAVTSIQMAQQRAAQRRAMDRARNAAISTEFTTSGGQEPLSFVVGTYATAGHMECPPMTHGPDDRPRLLLNYVISVSDVPGCTLRRMWIDEKEWTASATVHPDYGTEGAGRWASRAWVKWKDGSQTTADAMLLAKYGSAAVRPWSSDMIGRGVCHAILTFHFDRSEFDALPRVMFEVDGIALYDPRKDSTVGGSGTHRWGNPATYEPSDNPMVIAYNVARGIELTGIGVWGGGYAAEDLPLAWWTAAMNECDVLVDDGDGGTEKQFRFGMEVKVNSTPASLLAECAVACKGRYVEQGGVLKPRVGGPGLPVMAISDSDIVVTAAQEERPFPEYSSLINAISASYPDPAQQWAATEGVVIVDDDAVAEDGEQLTEDLQFPGVPYPGQVQRLVRAMLKEERRFARYSGVMAPDALPLEPMDVVAFTSPARGYDGKLFEVAGTDEHPTLQLGISLREVDPNDDIPVVPVLPDPVDTAPQAVDGAALLGFAASATSLPDASGTPRLPGIALSWTATAFGAGDAVEYKVETTAGSPVTSGVVTASTGAATVSEGLASATSYRVAARLFGVAGAVWTGWITVTTPTLTIGTGDLATGAVSSTAHVLTAGSVSVTSTTPVEAQALTFAASGAPLMLSATVQMDESYAELALTLDGTTVAAWRAGALAVGAGWRPQTVTLTARSAAAAGSRSIKIMAAKYDAGDPDVALSKRFLQIAELKR